MKTIQKLMGHRHIGTTSLYCDVSDETLRNAVELLWKMPFPIGTNRRM